MKTGKPGKQKILVISGNQENDVLHDEDFAAVAELQALAWKFEHQAHVAAMRLWDRIRHGATVEATQYYFDRKNRMVRSRQTALAVNQTVRSNIMN